MILIDLMPVPNQALSITVDEVLWELTFKAAGSIMAADIIRDGEAVVLGQRVVADAPIIPYAYLSEQGNFMFLTPQGEIPWWEDFGSTHTLVYLSPEEVGL